MKSFAAAVLLLAASVSAQSARSDVIVNSRDPTAAAPAAPAQAAPAAPSPPAAPRTAAAAPPAGPVNPLASCTQCFGPAIGNPLAVPYSPFALQHAMEVARNVPNLRLFFDNDGSIVPTDQFGREVEVLDSITGKDAFDIEDQLEFQQQQARQAQQLQLQRQRLESELSSIMRLIGGGAAGAAPAGPARAAAPPSRFFLQA